MESIEEQKKESNNGSAFNVKDLLWVCLARWYWFVLALAITLGYAVYFLAKTPRIYQSTAGILIKEGGSNQPDIASTFSEISGFNTNQNINNEMVAIKSPLILNEVSHRLGLDVNYMVKDGLRERVLYGPDLPITMRFVDLGENGRASLKLKYKGDGTVELGPFTANNENLDEISTKNNIKVNLEDVATDTIMTPVGRVTILENPRFEGSKSAPVEMRVDRVGYSAGASHNVSTDVRDPFSSVMYISVSDVNIARVNDILQTIIDVYNENWIADRNMISVSTSNFINERLAVIEDELGDVDSDISNYKTAHQITDPNSLSNIYFNRTMTASDEIAEMNSNLAQARQIRDLLSNPANAFNILPGYTGIRNIGIEGQIANYNTKLIERNNLVANSSENSPVIADIDAQLAGIRQSIISAIDSYIVVLNSEISGTRMRQAASSSQLANSPSQAKDLLSYERKQKVKESLYLYLLQKREENELSQAFTAYNTRLVMPPTAVGPVYPVSNRTYTMALALGLIIPAALIIIIEIFYSKVRGRRDLNRLTIPFVGEIPQTGRKKKKGIFSLFRKKKDAESSEPHFVVKRRSGNIINEAFRVVRTNLEFMVPDGIEKSRVIMLTSANAGSGKTFITLNLAAVISFKEKTVAIVDLDLRKGTMSASFGKPSKGVSNILSGTATADDVVIRNIGGFEGLDLYPAGPLPPNPAELLFNERIVRLVKELRDKYDYVMLDCPPVEVVADAKIINRLADLTVFIIRAGLLERSLLPEIQSFYDEKRYKNMAVILNGSADPTEGFMKRGNRYGYTYGYAYGYGYGYDKKKEKEEEKEENK